ncbi:MAG: ion transporter [Clostridia bacterium]|nr:ion transporter [Clostridia bacterium]
MRKKIFEMIEPSNRDGLLGRFYDFIMIAAIVASVVPLAFKTSYLGFEIVEYVCVGIFVIDYVLRMICADFILKKGKASFFLYPISPMAVIDIIAILPSVSLLNEGFKLLKIFRLLRTFKVFRAFKFFRYSKTFDVVYNVFKKQKNILITVMSMAVAYIFVSALIMYNVEPDTFNSFFDAIYWSTISLTSVGYGDIVPVTAMGKVITMLSSVLGIAIIALPSGVITAGYLAEITKLEDEDDDDHKYK